MDTGEILSQVAAYTQKFVDAAIPVAKQAYEIGLLTLRIDALQTIIPSLLVMIFSIVIFCKCKKTYKNAMAIAKEKKIMSRWEDSYDWAKAGCIPLDGGAVGIPWIFSLAGIVVPLILLCNIWLWVQLFKPELWLAKQAITAVLNATGAK